MKKLLTLLLALCMIATLCTFSVSAASDGLKAIYKNYELGTSTILNFDGLTTVPAGFTTQDANANATIDNDALKISKDTTGSAVEVEVRPDSKTYGEPELNESKRCLFSFKFKLHQSGNAASSLSLSIGPSATAKNVDLKIVLNSNSLSYSDGCTTNGSASPTTKSVDCSYTESDTEWTRLNILTNYENRKYYVWLGDCAYEDTLTCGEFFGPYSMCVNDKKTLGYANTLRIWMGTAQSRTAALWIDDYSVTPLVSRSNPLSDAAVALACVNSETIMGTDSLKSAEQLGIDANVEYVAEKEDYINNGTVIFPLFEGVSDVTVNVTGEGVSETKTFSDVVFPSGYTAIGSAIATGKTVSIPVTLRNSASAREDELLVIAAVYDKATKALIASNPCNLKGNTFVAEFDKDVSGDNYEVRGFVWQKGTLRPVK